MSKYNEFREMFGNASPEEKLAIIRSESRRLLIPARSESAFIHELIEERKPPELPDDFDTLCQKVVDRLEEFRDVINALTDREHRSILREEQAKHDKEYTEKRWRHTQQDLPELEKYTSLRDALESTANQLEISLLTPKVKIDDSVTVPGGGVIFHGIERLALIGPQASRQDPYYFGYGIKLTWLFDKRNLKWREHEGLAPSLEEAVTVLHLWLVKNVDLDFIQHEYSWMKSGRIDRDV